MPSPDDCDYGSIAEQCRKQSDYCRVAGGAGLPDIINSTGQIRTMEQALVDLALEEPAGLLYIDRNSLLHLYNHCGRGPHSPSFRRVLSPSSSLPLISAPRSL